MGSSSSVLRPQEIIEFRKLNTSIDNVEIPARPENRSLTDKKGFIIFAVGILLLLPFLIYTLIKSDPDIIYRDSCGNFCGITNPTYRDLSCSGRDKSDSPYLKDRECVRWCSDQAVTISGHKLCLPAIKTSKARNPFETRGFQGFDNDVDDRIVFNNDHHFNLSNGPTKTANLEWWKFLITIGITIALGILTLVALRYVPSPLVWGVVIFSMILLVVLTGVLWYGYFQMDSTFSPSGRNVGEIMLPVCVAWTVVAVIILIIFAVLFKKIGLVVQLYKETTKVLAAMPMLVFVPIWTTIIQVIIFAIAAATTYFMFFAFEWNKIGEDRYVYTKNGVMVFALVFNIVVTAWVMRFFQGIQFMTISGSVGTWYFSKNKQYLDSPISTSFGITMKFHLGTICFGSLILTLFSVVKAVLKALCRNACCRCCVLVCCNRVDVLFKFLSESSYIETALHGQSYLRSAKRATKLLLQNAASVVAISCVGDFVLAVIVLMVSLIATAISFALFVNNDVGVAIPATLICFFINLIIISIIFATFQTIIDTLFICFCEDSVLNDGMARPYYMSRGLMEFVENSKKVYGEKPPR